MLHQAKKRLHRERKWLALRLREVYTDEEREELFERWGIVQMKERKKALALRLWDSMVRAPELVRVHLSSVNMNQYAYHCQYHRLDAWL